MLNDKESFKKNFGKKTFHKKIEKNLQIRRKTLRPKAHKFFGGIFHRTQKTCYLFSIEKNTFFQRLFNTNLFQETLAKKKKFHKFQVIPKLGESSK